MNKMNISRAFTLIESGPVVLVTTSDGKKNNIMTISWTMVLDFTPVFAITTGEWNYSLRKEKRTVHAVGDGTFITDGRKLSRKKMMASKLPDGIQGLVPPQTVSRLT